MLVLTPETIRRTGRRLPPLNVLANNSGAPISALFNGRTHTGRSSHRSTRALVRRRRIESRECSIDDDRHSGVSIETRYRFAVPAFLGNYDSTKVYQFERTTSNDILQFSTLYSTL